MSDQSSAAEVAQELAQALEQRGQEYALGGAIALGYWGTPRGTVDVDVTVFVSPREPASCVQLLREIGCQVDTAEAMGLLQEHGFCHARYRGVRVDVFLPIVPFYGEARRRRARVRLGDQDIMVWSAEVLAVFKMMFFRRKDLADVEEILRVQGESLDRNWIRSQLVEMYGRRDPRISYWDELCAEIGP